MLKFTKLFNWLTLTKLTLNIKNTCFFCPYQLNIHGGEALKELLLSQETFPKNNFTSSLTLLGCVILGTLQA